jgi:hypothetical protein
MARYSLSNTLTATQQNLSSAFKTIDVVTAATGATTLRRGWIDEVIVGADGSINSTDCQVLWDWSVQTNVGTANTVTPQPTPEGADAAALLVYAVNATSEGTVTAASTLLAFPTNQRQSQRVTYADFRMTPLIVPAVNLKGVAGRAKSPTYVSTVQMQEYVVE